MHFTVFYAWQSDRPGKTTKNFIKKAAESAIKAINDDASIELAPSLDHDTKGVPGIPDIPSTICKKIDDCGIFLADMTFIGTTEATGDKSTPRYLSNPNVLIELGYALARIGPGRIIYVMNVTYGDASKLPFDIQARRHPITYELTEDQTDTTTIRNALSKQLETAMRAIASGGALRSPLASVASEIAYNAKRIQEFVDKRYRVVDDAIHSTDGANVRLDYFSCQTDAFRQPKIQEYLSSSSSEESRQIERIYRGFVLINEKFDILKQAFRPVRASEYISEVLKFNTELREDAEKFIKEWGHGTESRPASG